MKIIPVDRQDFGFSVRLFSTLAKALLSHTVAPPLHLTVETPHLLTVVLSTTTSSPPNIFLDLLVAPSHKRFLIPIVGHEGKSYFFYRLIFFFFNCIYSVDFTELKANFFTFSAQTSTIARE